MSDEQAAGVEFDGASDAGLDSEADHQSDAHGERASDDSEVDLDFLGGSSGEPDDHDHHPPGTGPAPQCAGCHRRGIELTLMENGKRYCERCAQEVERLMGIGPLFPDLDSGSEDSRSADVTPAGGARSKTPAGGVSAGTAVAERRAGSTTRFESPPKRSAADDAAAADARAELMKVVAAANREAAAAARVERRLIPRLTGSKADTAEEQPAMEQEVDQPKPAQLGAPPVSTAAATSATPSPPSDLSGVLAAEQERLLQEREALEERFRTDLDAIDQRLIHVESLLATERDSLAS